MAGRLEGKVAIVTGAGRGIGRAEALLLAQEGARVIVNDVGGSKAGEGADTTPAEEVVAEIKKMGGEAIPNFDSVTSFEAGERMVKQALDTWGRLDILVNNAGIATTTSFLDQDEAGWRDIMATNLDGAWRVARTAARQMAAHGRGGSIINIASILGLRPAARVSAYAAAKAALISLTQTMALELARHGIRVNALAPGYVETDLNRDFLQSPAGTAMVKRVPLRRFGTPEDLDGAILLLASDAGRYMTGSVVVVDGGHALGFL